jgi:VCBS repeat-containing protein
VATASGDLDATDVDSAATFVAQSNVTKTYGTFTIDAAGTWSYTLDDGNAAVQALNAGDTLHELVTVATADGTTQVVDVTINGANDAAVITGTATGSVTEKSGVANGTAGVATASGDLDATDVDSAATFVAQSNVPRPTARSRSTRPARGATRSTTATGMSRRSMPATRCTSWSR